MIAPKPNYSLRILVGLLVLLIAAATLSAQAAPPIEAAGPPADTAASPAEAAEAAPTSPDAVAAGASLLQRFALPRCDGFPLNLRGQARAFAIGDADDHLAAALYVPSYYDGGRGWPVLIEGTQRGKLPPVVQQMIPQAERHGFILLVVEYRYFEGRVEREVDVWTRRGDSTIRVTSRPFDEMLRDIVADERLMLTTLQTLKRHYNIEERAVGVTGFLGASLMSYRMPLAYPQLFCTGISRSGDFHHDFLPARMGANARMTPISIIYGEKESDITLETSQQAAAWFRRRDFANLTVERIPYSGVDSRPEIAANCFRAAIDKAVGEETAAFLRLANQAGLLLADRWIADASTGMSKLVAANHAERGLARFLEQYPRSAHGGQARLLMARLKVELLEQNEQARGDLEAFLKAPLFSNPSAPQALIYLVERFHPPDQQPREALQILNRLRLRRMSDDQQARLSELIALARRSS